MEDSVTKNYFCGQIGYPHHLSVGAVVVREDGRICCHHFLDKNGFKDLYLLMRETLEPNETIEQALVRGLSEEFNIEAELSDFLGPIVSRFEGNGRRIEKTTLYFLCKYLKERASHRNIDDAESDSIIEWLESNDLMAKMKDQFKRYGREDTDESEIIARILK